MKDMETQNNNNDQNQTDNKDVNNNPVNNPGGAKLFGSTGRFGKKNGPGNISGNNKNFGNKMQNGIKKLKGGGRFFGFVILALIVFLTIEGGFYRVDEQEAAVVTMFGNVIRTDTAGLYFKIPWIQQVTKVDTTIHGTGIGYAVNDDGQTFTVDTEGIMITSDFNLIDIDFYMEYRVSDPVAYLYNSKQPEYILKNVALARNSFDRHRFYGRRCHDNREGTDPVPCKAEDAGAQLTEQNIGLRSSILPCRTRNIPQRRSSAHSRQSRPPSRARTLQSTMPINTRTSRFPPRRQTPTDPAECRGAESRPNRLEGEGQVARFNAMYKEYANNPSLITKQRLFL